MLVGIGKEKNPKPSVEEQRIGLSPSGTREIIEAGAKVIVESGAGERAGFANGDYERAGAALVYSNEEVFARSDIVAAIGRPPIESISLMKEGSILTGFLHLPIALKGFVDVLKKRNLTAISYEEVKEDDGGLPLLKVSSEIAGKLAPQIAGSLLESTNGGLGVVLGGAPGIPPADVVILGCGTLGYYCARSFLGLGATVYMLDSSKKRLEQIDVLFEGRVITALATRENIEKFVAFAEVLIGSVLKIGEIAPIVVTRDMVKKMRKGTVIIDFSVDQGGCIETTRNSGGRIQFIEEGVIHFASPNVPSKVARSATHALTHAILPYLISIIKSGFKETLSSYPEIRRGTTVIEGIFQLKEGGK